MTPSKHFIAIIRRFALTSFLAFSTCNLAEASYASEPEYLDAMIRQLNALEETAQRSAQTSADTSQRYSFDYQRLAEDIARIRHGINDYLSPHRAQPRDPVELSGSYTMEARKP